MIAGELHLGFVEEVVDEPDAWRLAELRNTVGEVGRGHRRLSTEGGEEKSHAVLDSSDPSACLVQDNRRVGPGGRNVTRLSIFFKKERTHGHRDLVISSYALWQRFLLLYNHSSLCRAVL